VSTEPTEPAVMYRSVTVTATLLPTTAKGTL